VAINDDVHTSLFFNTFPEHIGTIFYEMVSYAACGQYSFRRRKNCGKQYTARKYVFLKTADAHL
jgi:hypothetical protein